MLIEYSTNNSDGEWWLTDEDWLALEAHGWKINWGDSFFFNETTKKLELRSYTSLAEVDANNARFIGAAARSATKEFPSMEMAIAEWEWLTSQDASARGCKCCGRPHYFSEV